ncbi:dephospho-CoA kinase [Cellvibrio sp. ARAG 10.3]|uniref:dephospho-CoA kinase n=1 Tax=Cellvibrio sp. ARAG 10.3 TaxID=3451358 RepID=UPI003F48AEA9
MKQKLIVGLTGGIGSGKSEVSRRFQALGIVVVDADEVARLVVEPGQAALADIAARFGSDIVSADGHLNRALLRKIIFSQPEEKRWLEGLLHPLINQEIRRQLADADSPYVILSSPLLLETRQHELVNRVLVIDASEALQIARASSRDGNSSEQIKTIMATQLDREARISRADDIIHNHGDLVELDAQVKTLHQRYMALASH